MADIDKVVVVTVVKTSAGISRQGFGTPMGVFQIPAAVQPGRFATYSTVQELIDAGSAATDRWVEWASIIKGQNPAPTTFAIGRREPGTAQVDTVTITTPDVGTWDITINTVVFSYIAGASDTAQTIAEGLKAAVDAGSVPVVTGAVVAGVFTVTADIAGEAFTNGGITVPGAGVGTFVNTTPNAAAEAMATALSAINTANSRDWYILTIETRNDTDITAADTFITPLRKVFVGQSSDPDARDGVASNIFDTIQALNNERTTLIWKSDDRHYADAGWAGIAAAADLDAAGGVITMAFKQATGVPVDDLTSGQITNIAGDGESNAGFGGNVYVDIASRGVFLYGQTTGGDFFDVQTTLDWTYFRVSEAVFGLLATTPTKIPFTNFGITSVQNEVKGVLDTGVTNGHFSGDVPPTVSVPDVSEVSTADKNARTLRNVIGNAVLAGAIHKTFVRVEVGV